MSQVEDTFLKQFDLVLKHFVPMEVNKVTHSLVQHGTELEESFLVVDTEEKKADIRNAEDRRSPPRLQKEGNFTENGGSAGISHVVFVAFAV